MTTDDSLSFKNIRIVILLLLLALAVIYTQQQPPNTTSGYQPIELTSLPINDNGKPERDPLYLQWFTEMIAERIPLS